MALWVGAKLVLCALFITCCCTVTLAQIPIDCCLDVHNKTIEKAAIADHRRQIGGQGCPIDATILVTRRDIKLCVPIDEPWVQEVVKHVENLKKFCKNKNYKPKRCFGVKPQ